MNAFDAFYHTVHSYPGGASSLAPRMGMSPDVLRNKADVKKEHHKPNLQDVISVMDLTGDLSILRALAADQGLLLVKASEAGKHECDMSVLEQVTGLMVEQGKFASEIYTSLADGSLTDKEMAAIEEAGRQFMTAIAEVKQRMKGMVG